MKVLQGAPFPRSRGCPQDSVPHTESKTSPLAVGRKPGSVSRQVGLSIGQLTREPASLRVSERAHKTGPPSLCNLILEVTSVIVYSLLGLPHT